MATNLSFETADLLVQFSETNGSAVNLQGFGITGNKDIIENSKTEKYGQLMWVSLGNPSIVQFKMPASVATNRTNNRDLYPEVFIFGDDGFNISIQTLSDAHRGKLVVAAKSKYKIDVSPLQIADMPLASLECRLDFYTLEKVKISIYGEALNLDVYPLVVSFNAPVGSNERMEFERKLRSCMNEGIKIDEISLPIYCVAKSGALSTKTNVFSISSQQMSKLGISERIFGPKSEVMVTRDQMQSLASQVHSRMNVYEEYQISNESFADKFVEEMIKKAADETFKPVSLDQALASLSSYDFGKDIQPDVIRKDLGKVIKVESSGNKQYLKVYDKNDDEGSNSNSASGSSHDSQGRQNYNSRNNANFNSSHVDDRSKQDSSDDSRTCLYNNSNNEGTKNSSTNANLSVDVDNKLWEVNAKASYDSNNNETWNNKATSLNSQTRQTQNNNAESHQSDSTSANRSNSVDSNVFNCKNDLAYAKSKENEWKNGNVSLEEQLKQLHERKDSEIQWEREGEWLVPKAINVTRLSRAQFEQQVNFERIRRVTVEASFEKKFTLDTRNNLRLMEAYSKQLDQHVKFQKLFKIMGQLAGTSDYFMREHLSSLIDNVKSAPVRNKIKQLLTEFMEELPKN